jgi:hypothetical protein
VTVILLGYSITTCWDILCGIYIYTCSFLGYTIWEILPKVRDPTSQQFHAALLGRGFVEVGPSLVLAIIDQSMFCIPILCGIEEEATSLQTPFDLFWEIVPIHLGLSKNVVPKIRRFIIIIQVSRFHSGFECHT